MRKYMNIVEQLLLQNEDKLLLEAGRLPQPLDDSKKEEIKQLYLQGIAPIDISRQLGLSQGTVDLYLASEFPLKDKRLKMDSMFKALNPADFTDIITKFRTGNYTLRALGEEYYISEIQVRKILKSQGMTEEEIKAITGTTDRNYENNKITPDIKEKILDMFIDGKNFSEIAVEFKVSTPTIIFHIKRMPHYNDIILPLHLENRVTNGYGRRVERPAPVELPEEIKDTILQLFSFGRSIADITFHIVDKMKINVTDSDVSKYLASLPDYKNLKAINKVFLIFKMFFISFSNSIYSSFIRIKITN